MRRCDVVLLRDDFYPFQLLRPGDLARRGDVGSGVPEIGEAGVWVNHRPDNDRSRFAQLEVFLPVGGGRRGDQG